MAMKWASFGRRRMSSTRTDRRPNSGACGSSVADKGHFVVYTLEGRRFVVPLPYLHSSIFRELLRISEEEYGLAQDGPITLPCDASSMAYMLSLLRRQVPADVERALLSSILEYQSSTCSLLSVGHNQQVALCSF